MDKRQLKQLIVKKILGTISSEEERLLTERLRDDHVRRLYDQLMAERTLSARYRHYISIDEDKAWQSFEQKHFPHKKAHWQWIAAAAAVVCLIVTYTVLNMNGGPSQPEMAENELKTMEASANAGRQMAMLDIEGKEFEVKDMSQYKTLTAVMTDTCRLLTKDDTEFWVTLSDGTIVHLNNNTRLYYPKAFDGAQRTVWLDGEAYFKIAHNSSKPFRVMTSTGVEVRDIGTEFDINTHTHTPSYATEVVLVSGEAEVITHAYKMRFRKNELARIKSDGTILATDCNALRLAAWHVGKHYMAGATMKEVMDVVSKWYGYQVFFDDEEARNYRLTGEIDRYGDVDSLLMKLQKISGLKMRTTNNTINISSK